MADDRSRIPVVEFAPLSGVARIRAAITDIRDGFHLLPLALTLGWLDIKMRYRGSILGPFWLTLSTAVMVGALGLIYGRLFHMDVAHYLPFLSLSIALWSFIAMVAGDAATVFTASASLFHSMRIPLTLPVVRVLVRNVLILLHNAVVVLGVFVLFHVEAHRVWALLPALLMCIMDCFAGVLLVGMLGARFRDIPPIVGSIIQIFFFVTPVIWAPSALKTGRDFLLLDPFYPVLELLRAPLLGGVTEPSLWYAALGQCVLLCCVAAVFFCRMRARIPYWI